MGPRRPSPPPSGGCGRGTSRPSPPPSGGCGRGTSRPTPPPSRRRRTRDLETHPTPCHTLASSSTDGPRRRAIAHARCPAGPARPGITYVRTERTSSVGPRPRLSRSPHRELGGAHEWRLSRGRSRVSSPKTMSLVDSSRLIYLTGGGESRSTEDLGAGTRPRVALRVPGAPVASAISQELSRAPHRSSN